METEDREKSDKKKKDKKDKDRKMKPDKNAEKGDDGEGEKKVMFVQQFLGIVTVYMRLYSVHCNEFSV